MGDQLQHYVPRFLLRQFGRGKKDHVRVYDKQSGASFAFSASKKSAIAVAAEYHMYDFEFAGEQVTIEPALADLESKTATLEIPGEDTLVVPFEVDDYTRWRLLEGLDDIALTLRNESAITEFESRRPAWMPRTLPVRR